MSFRKVSVLILLLQGFYLFSFSQSKYWIFFTDKKEVCFDPYEYFDSKAIARRIQHHIPLVDSTDFPLNDGYVRSVTSRVDSAGKQSHWFNALVVYATETQLLEISKLSFVKEIQPIYTEKGIASNGKEFKTELTAEEDELLKNQLESMQGSLFKEKDINGKGVRIAIFDAGFPSVDVNPAFEEIRKENRIIKTYDFIRNSDNVYAHSSHGTMVFSCIAGKIGDKQIGLATGAEFLLARTEYGVREPFSEEENWLAAVEWADKNGAQIINSSLGYTYHRYFTEDMNGHVSLVSKAANMAARKGILVVNAVGNEGGNKWKTIITPADADSVLSIGGISPKTNIHTSFSSYGPTGAKKLKPNVCAYGHVIASSPGGLKATQGTSFASPLIAGFAACVLQAKPSLKNMELFHEIEKAGTLYPYYDYAHGYGMPQASYSMNALETKNAEECPFEIKENSGMLEVIFEEKEYNNYENNQYLFYHVENPTGYLDKYYVVEVGSKVPVRLILSDYKKGSIIRFHWKKWTKEYKIE